MRIESTIPVVGAAGLSLAAMLVSGCFSEEYGWDTAPDVSEAGSRPNSEPVRAVIDTDQTMEIQPGKGVGLFIEYETGGVWRVRTACDTSLGTEPCFFQIYAILPTTSHYPDILPESDSCDSYGYWSYGTLNLGGSWYERVLQFETYVTDGVGRLVFRIEPGMPVQFLVYLDFMPESRFTYWAGDGALHYGAPSNPIELEPSTP